MKKRNEMLDSLKGKLPEGKKKNPMLELSDEDFAMEEIPAESDEMEMAEEGPEMEEASSELEMISDDDLMAEIKRRGLKIGEEKEEAEIPEEEEEEY